MRRSVFAIVGILALASASGAVAGGGYHGGGWHGGGSHGGGFQGGGLHGGVGARSFSYASATATSQSSAFSGSSGYARGGSFSGGYGRGGRTGYGYAQGTRGGGGGRGGYGRGYGYGYGAGFAGFALGSALADAYGYGYGPPDSYAAPGEGYYGSSYGGEVSQPYAPDQGEVYGAYSAYDQDGYYGGQADQAAPPYAYPDGEGTYPAMGAPLAYAPSGLSYTPAMDRCGC